MIAIQDPLGQLPPQASTFAPDVDSLFYFLVWVSLVFFTLILGVLVYSAIVYRRKTEDQPAASTVTHNTTLEVVWTLIPTVIVMFSFAWGLKGNLDQQVAPGDALQYRVEARQWTWNFYHPGDTAPASDLYVPVNVPAKFTLTSPDVLHSFYVPAMRTKRDVVPGVRQIAWFQPTVLNPPQYDSDGNIIGGGFHLFCAEYCGMEHSKMNRKVYVITQEDFDARIWDQMPEDPIERGRFLYTTQGCLACHSLDGSVILGPSFKGIWMREGRLTNGESYVADEAYIRESIRTPSAKIVQPPEGRTFESTTGTSLMSPFTPALISDEYVGDIIEWMKTLK